MSEATSQRQIVAQLLSQQPTLVQASVSRNPSPLHAPPLPAISPADYQNFLLTIKAMQASMTPPTIGKTPEGNTEDVTPEARTEDVVRFSSSPCSNPSPSVPPNGVAAGAEPEYKPRNVREKVYADGFIMSFDKKSSCGTKYFWRCERKNDCNARMHSDMATRQIVRKLHPHNHPKPTAEELSFYGQDFSSLEPNVAHPVKPINRSMMARKMSRDTAQAKITHQQLMMHEPMDVSDAAPTNNLLATLNAVVALSPSPAPSPQKRSFSRMQPVKLKCQRRKQDDEDELITDEEFRLTCELAKKLKELVKPTTEIGVRWQGAAESVLLFLSPDNGAAENVFFPVVLLKRDEQSLKKALEGFTGKRCEGRIVMTFSEKVRVLVHSAMINSWTHGKLFLVDTSVPCLWRLTPVDLFGETISSS